MRIFITGAAGFIGFHLAKQLLERGHQVDGYDGMTPYYDVRLKEARLAQLAGRPGFAFHRVDLADRAAVEALVAANPGITGIVHLAAQAGVRHSMVDPYAYVASNVLGHLVVLEAAE